MRLLIAFLSISALAVAQPVAVEKKAGKIEGTVVHSVTGAPIGRVNVTLMPTMQPQVGGGTISMANLPQPAGVATTGADGKFSLANVPAGSYMIRLERNGFLVAANVAGAQPALLGIAEGQEVTGLTYKLAPISVLVVRALDENGEPVNRATVQVMRNVFLGGRRQLMPVGGGQTNDLGENRVQLTAGAGRYVVMVSPSGMTQSGPLALPARTQGQISDEITLPTYYPGVIDRTQALPVNVGVGQEVPVTVTLQKGRVFRIRGKVPEGTAAGGSVTAMPRSDGGLGIVALVTYGLGRPTQVKPDGTFELTGVAPGSYNVVMSRMAGIPTTGSTAKATVEVANSDVEGVMLAPVVAMTVKGRVIIEGNNGDGDRIDLSAARIGLSSMEGLTAGSSFGEVAADGAFTINGVTEGRYQPQLMGNMAGSYRKAVRMGDVDVTKTGIDLYGASSAPPIEIIYSRKVAKVDVTVLRSAPERSPGVVLLVPDSFDPNLFVNESPYLTLQVNQAGVASHTAVPPGKYRVYAMEVLDQIEGIDPDVLKRLESKSERVDVGEGATASVAVKQLVAADLEVR